jgi:ubiquinone/menaquinone biosynthesis C-methylase UbiE
MAEAPRFQYDNPSVPAAYDAFFVPRIFAPWADLLLNAADIRSGHAVLDIASGTGVVARLAALRTHAAGRVVAADIAPLMLKIARAKPAQPGAAPITYIESPAAPLAVASASFDRVLCQQGLQFFPDRLAAVKEMRRALKPGGIAAIAVWCEIELNPIFHVFREVLRAVAGPEVASVMGAPFGLADGAALAGLLSKSGFANPRVTRQVLPVTFELGIDQAIAAFAATPLAPQVNALPPDRQEQIRDGFASGLQHLLRGSAVVSEMTANIAVGTAP